LADESTCSIPIITLDCFLDLPCCLTLMRGGHDGILPRV
jgi:hypothetical protein